MRPHLSIASPQKLSLMIHWMYASDDISGPGASAGSRLGPRARTLNRLHNHSCPDQALRAWPGRTCRRKCNGWEATESFGGRVQPLVVGFFRTRLSSVAWSHQPFPPIGMAAEEGELGVKYWFGSARIWSGVRALA